MNDPFGQNAWDQERDVLVRVEGLSKSYFRGHEMQVLRGVDLEVHRGEVLAITGSSGSGKSTLLHLLATLDQPDAGAIWYENERIDNRGARFRDRFRNETIGLIFQFYHLLPELTALENVLLPSMIRESFWSFGRNKPALRQRAISLLEQVGLGARMHHRSREMSGGEMQRAAIARALMAAPPLLLADEPTGNLDTETGATVMELLLRLSREHRLTVVMVTHDLDLADRADRNLRLAAGRLAPAGVVAS